MITRKCVSYKVMQYLLQINTIYIYIYIITRKCESYNMMQYLCIYVDTSYIHTHTHIRAQYVNTAYRLTHIQMYRLRQSSQASLRTGPAVCGGTWVTRTKRDCSQQHVSK